MFNKRIIISLIAIWDSVYYSLRIPGNVCLDINCLDELRDYLQKPLKNKITFIRNYKYSDLDFFF